MVSGGASRRVTAQRQDLLSALLLSPKRTPLFRETAVYESPVDQISTLCFWAPMAATGRCSLLRASIHLLPKAMMVRQHGKAARDIACTAFQAHPPISAKGAAVGSRSPGSQALALFIRLQKWQVLPIMSQLLRSPAMACGLNARPVVGTTDLRIFPDPKNQGRVPRSSNGGRTRYASGVPVAADCQMTITLWPRPSWQIA